jgi:hypothetical protein
MPHIAVQAYTSHANTPDIGHNEMSQAMAEWWRELDSRKREEDAVGNSAHADVPCEHVIEVHEQRPPELCGHVCAQQCEQHAHNVQHHSLHRQWFSDENIITPKVCEQRSPELCGRVCALQREQ